MLRTYLILLGCQTAGETVHQLSGVPISGPVIGMVLLLAVLSGRGGASDEFVRSSNGTLRYLSLFFVPPGVGIVQQLPLLRTEWLPMLLGVVISTALAMISGALVMRSVNRLVQQSRRVPIPQQVADGG